MAAILLHGVTIADEKRDLIVELFVKCFNKYLQKIAQVDWEPSLFFQTKNTRVGILWSWKNKKLKSRKLIRFFSKALSYDYQCSPKKLLSLTHLIC